MLIVEGELETVRKSCEELLADGSDGIAGEVELRQIDHVGEDGAIKNGELVVAQVQLSKMLQILERCAVQSRDLIVGYVDLLDCIPGREEISRQGRQFVAGQIQLLQLGWSVEGATLNLTHITVAKVNHLQLIGSGEHISCELHLFSACVELREFLRDFD